MRGNPNLATPPLDGSPPDLPLGMDFRREQKLGNLKGHSKNGKTSRANREVSNLIDLT